MKTRRIEAKRLWGLLQLTEKIKAKILKSNFKLLHKIIILMLFGDCKENEKKKKSFLCVDNWRETGFLMCKVVIHVIQIEINDELG